MTAPNQPKAPPTQRVSDASLQYRIDTIATAFNLSPQVREGINMLALDLRDTRAILADAQTAFAAKDVRIAELEADKASLCESSDGLLSTVISVEQQRADAKARLTASTEPTADTGEK